jgi:hypothetical protein
MTINEETVTIPKSIFLSLKEIAVMFGQQNDLVELGAELCHTLDKYKDSLPDDVQEVMSKLRLRAKECFEYATKEEIKELFEL